MADFYIKQNDTLPTLFVRLIGPPNGGSSTSYPIPHGAAIKFVMRRQSDKSIVVSSTSVVVVDALNGVVRYDWQPADTLNQGLYDIEFEMTVGAQRITFPNNTYKVVEILADLTTQ